MPVGACCAVRMFRSCSLSSLQPSGLSLGTHLPRLAPCFSPTPFRPTAPTLALLARLTRALFRHTPLDRLAPLPPTYALSLPLPRPSGTPAQSWSSSPNTPPNQPARFVAPSLPPVLPSTAADRHPLLCTPGVPATLYRLASPPLAAAHANVLQSPAEPAGVCHAVAIALWLDERCVACLACLTLGCGLCCRVLPAA